MSKNAISWALYDWANSAFATVVIAGFFPLLLKNWWAADMPAPQSSFYLGAANSIASLTIVILAPLLGALADQLAWRKRILLAYAFLGILMSLCLALIPASSWILALLVFVLAVIGFSGANGLYDALLPSVAGDRVDQVSALGFALGYLGGGLLFLINVLLVMNPEWLGFSDPISIMRGSFVSVALWWAVFSLPLMLYVPEPAATAQQDCLWAGIKSSLSELRHTLIHMRQMRPVWLFLLAYWLYIDGVNTVIRMAVDYGAALGFSNNDLIAALLLTQFIGFPATIAFGWLGQRLGAKNGIFVAIAVYLIIILWASQMQQVYEFYALAVAIALVQGGIQALSRSYYSRLIPLQRTAEFYGFYNMLGKFAAVLGPVMMGAAAFMLGDSRYSILVLAVFFVLGGWLLSKVNEPTQKNKH